MQGRSMRLTVLLKTVDRRTFTMTADSSMSISEFSAMVANQQGIEGAQLVYAGKAQFLSS